MASIALRSSNVFALLLFVCSAHALSCSTSVTPIDAGSYAEQTIRSLLSLYQRMDPNLAYVFLDNDGTHGAAVVTLPVPRAEQGTVITPPCYLLPSSFASSRNPGNAYFTYPGGRQQLYASSRDFVAAYITSFSPFPIQPGDRVVFETTGGDFPAFRAEIVFPPPVRLIQPQPSASPIPLRRDQPLQLQWEPTWAMFVLTSVYNTDSYGPGGTIRCIFVATQGSGTIPAEALSLLAPGEARLAVAGMEMNIVPVAHEPLVVQARNFSAAVHFRLE